MDESVQAKREEIELLVTVKAYPSLSQTYGEAVCVAGIQTAPAPSRWVRLFPVQYRQLPDPNKFHKYQFIRLRVGPHSDARPESRRPDLDSLTVGAQLLTKKDKTWARRRAIVEPLVIESMCELQRRQASDGTSLGVFPVSDLDDFYWEEDTDRWGSKQEAISQQPSLFAPTASGLEKIPYKFRYRYRCADRKCNGHRQLIIDWELAQSYRRWRGKYGPTGVLEQLKKRWLDEMCAPERDTHFFSGNMSRYPESFLVLGVFWPPKS